MNKTYVVRIVFRGHPYWLANQGKGWQWLPNQYDAHKFYSRNVAGQLGLYADQRSGIERRQFVEPSSQVR